MLFSFSSLPLMKKSGFEVFCCSKYFTGAQKVFVLKSTSLERKKYLYKKNYFFGARDAKNQVSLEISCFRITTTIIITTIIIVITITIIIILIKTGLKMHALVSTLKSGVFAALSSRAKPSAMENHKNWETNVSAGNDT